MKTPVYTMSLWTLWIILYTNVNYSPTPASCIHNTDVTSFTSNIDDTLHVLIPSGLCMLDQPKGIVHTTLSYGYLEKRGC